MQLFLPFHLFTSLDRLGKETCALLLRYYHDSIQDVTELDPVKIVIYHLSESECFLAVQPLTQPPPSALLVADYYNTEDDTAIEEDVECGEWLCIGHRESSGKQTQAPTQRPSPKRAKEKPAPAPDTTKAPTSHLPNGQGRHRQDPQPSSSPLRRSRRLLELHATRETQVYPRHEGNATATSSSSGTSTGSGGGRGRDPSLTARYTSSFRSWLEMAEAQRRKAETGIVPRHPDK
ncbi:hypothetical protein F5B18DRAFT_170109 [Nemania serpens]|nr:hypothetical protein F5B18DRAFT_170109 [Nemania serpens]